MKANVIMAAVTFFAVLVVTIAGVFLFFQPLSRGDASIVQVHPLIAVLSYVGLCTWIYLWAARETGSSYKAAFVLVAPQAALIMDLTFRAERGMVTGLAGIALLIITWFAVAFAHQFFGRRLASGGDGGK